MGNPPFWWYLPGMMGIFMGYVSLPEGTIISKFLWRTVETVYRGTLESAKKRQWQFMFQPSLTVPKIAVPISITSFQTIVLTSVYKCNKWNIHENIEKYHQFSNYIIHLIISLFINSFQSKLFGVFNPSEKYARQLGSFISPPGKRSWKHQKTIF